MTRLFQVSEHTFTEFDRDASRADVEAVLHKLAQYQAGASGKVCYVYGMGAHPKSVYTSLNKHDGLCVNFYRSVLPAGIRFLSRVVASYEGVIKIEDSSRLQEVFLSLIHQSMAAIYFFDAELEDDFLRSVRGARKRESLDFGIKVDPGYSIYLVDADNAESTTGIVEIISYGRSVPNEIVPIIT